MRYLFGIVIFFSCLIKTAQAQEISSKLEVYSGYMPEFTVQEATDSQVRPLGVRLMVSDYDMAPLEFGIHAYARYGKTARLSYGVSLAFLIGEWKAHDFKAGLSMSKIDLEDVLIEDVEIIGPQVGDVHFQGFGNEFKPFIEWEWLGTQFASFFVQMSYRIINGEKTVVTEVEEVYNPVFDAPMNELRERDWSFFYSGSGFEIGFGVNIHLLRNE